MNLQEFWNQFVSTGKPTTYWLYQKPAAERNYHGSNHMQRAGHSGNRFR